jgi:peptidyl-prolyl cis-trans isomerase D
MLLQMRQLTRSWIAYVLIFLLAATFVIFLGNGQSILDAFQTQSSSHLAKGRDVAVTQQSFANEFQRTLRQAREQGATFTQQEAVERGFHKEVLDRIVQREALFAYARRVGVAASGAQVGNEIRNTEGFENPISRAFDRQLYADILRREGFTETEYENNIRDSLATTQLMRALTSGVRAPASYGALAVIYQGETRTISVALADASVIGAIAAPTEAQLQSFYQENQARLRLPEFRALTLVFARQEDFVARVNIPEDRLAAEIERRRAAASRPETRTYVRISAQTEAQANQAAQRLARGEDPNAIAAALGVQASRSENQARAAVPDAPVAEAVFSAPVRGAPRVVRSQLSPWAVVRVESMTPAAAPDAAELREAVRLAIANDEAGVLLNTAIEAFEEARDGGATLAEAAQAAGLPIANVAAVTERGQGRDGAPIPALAEAPDLLAAAFDTPEGEASDFLSVDGADVVVGVDRVIPESVRPFAEVRDDLARLWAARERERRLRAIGEATLAAVRGGDSLAAAARANRLRMVRSSISVNRANAVEALGSQGLAAQAFAAREGAAVMDVAGDRGVLVALVEEIERPDPAQAPQLVEAGRVAAQQTLTQSFGMAVQAQIVDAADINRNADRLDQLYRPNADDAAVP